MSNSTLNDANLKTVDLNDAVGASSGQDSKFNELVESTSCTASENIHVKSLSFPAKLHAILERSDLSDIISWMPHGRAWRVHKPKAFESKVIPVFFVQCKYSSFIRQANGWGFRRITKGPDCNAYYNEFFLRGRPQQCQNMRRPAKSMKRPIHPTFTPDFYALPPLDTVTNSQLESTLNNNQVIPSYRLQSVNDFICRQPLMKPQDIVQKGNLTIEDKIRQAQVDSSNLHNSMRLVSAQNPSVVDTMSNSLFLRQNLISQYLADRRALGALLSNNSLGMNPTPSPPVVIPSLNLPSASSKISEIIAATLNENERLRKLTMYQQNIITLQHKNHPFPPSSGHY